MRMLSVVALTLIFLAPFVGLDSESVLTYRVNCNQDYEPKKRYNE